MSVFMSVDRKSRVFWLVSIVWREGWLFSVGALPSCNALTGASWSAPYTLLPWWCQLDPLGKAQGERWLAALAVGFTVTPPSGSCCFPGWGLSARCVLCPPVRGGVEPPCSLRACRLYVWTGSKSDHMFWFHLYSHILLLSDAISQLLLQQFSRI